MPLTPYNQIDDEERWITRQMIQQARHNYALPRQDRVDIFNDAKTEEQAAHTPYQGTSVKGTVDDWIIEHDAHLERTGPHYYVNMPQYPWDGMTYVKIGTGKNIVIEYFEMARRRYDESLLADSLTS